MKNALFTAGSSYIAFDCLNLIASKGYNIAIHYSSNLDKITKTVNLLKHKYPNNKFAVYKCDFSDANNIGNMMKEVIEDFNSIDLVINNASSFERSNIYNETVDNLNKMFNIHLYSPIFILQNIINNTKAKVEDRIDIINIIDANIYGSKIADRFFGYLLSKQSLDNYTKITAKLLAPKIRTNSISIGYIEKDTPTDIPDINIKLQQIPMQITTKIIDVVNAINYIIENKIINGHDIVLDGGEYLP